MRRNGFIAPVVVILLTLMFFGSLWFLKQKLSKDESPSNQIPSANNQSVIKEPQFNYFVFVRNGDIYLFSKDQQHELLVKSGKVRKIVWAPDHSRFFYSEDNLQEVSGQGGYQQINSIYDFKNKKILTVSNSFQNMQFKKWSNDSKRILGVGGEGSLPVIYDFENQTATEVSFKDYSHYVRVDQWDFSPDGTQLVFLTNEGRLYLQNLKSGSSRLFGEGSRLRGPVLWSPNGQDIVFVKDYETNGVSAAAGDLILIRQDATSLSESKTVGEVRFAYNDALRPEIWSSDGKKLLLYFPDQIYDIQKVKKISISKGEEYSRFFPGAGSYDMYWISNNLLISMGMIVHNDKSVDYDKAFYKLLLLDAELGTFKVYDIKSEPKLSAGIASASPDGQNILISKQVSDQKTSDLYNFDLKEQKETQLINNAGIAAWGK